jgi:cytochrome c553
MRRTAAGRRTHRVPTVLRLARWLALCHLAMVTQAAGQAVRAPASMTAFEGDAAAGREAAAACAACHGAQGEGNAEAAYPRLAGQAGYYLYKQLNDYADGSRPNEVMTPIASQLDDAQRRNLAAHFAQQAGTASHAASRATTARASIERGRRLAERGSAQRGLQACSNCHGPAGVGLPPDVPYLAGQSVRYTLAQLDAWRRGTRRNDSLAVMRDAARRLSDREARDVAAYFASLPPVSRR